MAYTRRYIGGFVDKPTQTTPVDATFLNAVEAALLKLFDTDPAVDGQALQWVAASSKFGPALLLNKNIDPAAAIDKSKLNLAGQIVDADVAGAAAIAGSKLANVPPSKLTGYPADVSKELRGDGSWVTGGMVLLGSLVLGGTATSFDTNSFVSGGTISQAYKNLRVIINARGDVASLGVGCILTVNADTGSNYERELVTFSGSSITGIGQDATTPLNIVAGNDFPAANATAGQFGAMVIDIPNYAGTTGWKSFLANGATHFVASNRISYRSDIVWRSTAAITRLQFATNGGNYIAGSSIFVYAY